MTGDIYRYNNEFRNIARPELTGIIDREYLASISARANYGCVVRAMESAFGVEALSNEWTRRTDDVQAALDQYPLTSASVEQRGINFALLSRMEDLNILNYFEWLKTRDSMMGRVMRLLHRVDIALSWEQISRVLQRSSYTKILTVAECPAQPERRHMLHLALNDDKLVDQNDHDTLVNPQQWRPQLSYIFIPKR